MPAIHHRAAPIGQHPSYRPEQAGECLVDDVGPSEIDDHERGRDRRFRLCLHEHSHGVLRVGELHVAAQHDGQYVVAHQAQAFDRFGWTSSP